ncbi:C1 domain containing protein [Oryctes borbonicus]|uniref:C1 domain containing protein n=1 Tax=Oryctes borbonicus TaxID=1629725 RepID=A0A0T6AUR8_9SCAR|nr:C1 domain containing protein [Oryctes borbonicus]
MAVEYDKLQELYNRNCEKFTSIEDIKMEDFKVQTVDALYSKAGNSFISDQNQTTRDILLENIKEEGAELLNKDISNTEKDKLGLKKIETIKVEIGVENENVPTLQGDPLSENNQTSVNFEVNKELGIKENPTHSTTRKSNSDVVFCKECNKTFSYQYYHKIHAPIHNGNTPFKCDICKKGFVKPSLLKMHKVTHSESRPYSCKTCRKHFKRRKDLMRHHPVHSDDRPFPCDQCDKSFLANSKLRAHKMSHQIDRTVSCEQCRELFKDKMGLYQHIRSAHLVKKVHICSYCGKTFSLRNTLTTHIKIHTGEKPFTCDVCKKSFARSSSLKRHTNVHTGERPYSCKMCLTKFTCSQSLKRHMKLHITSKIISD